MERHPDRFGMPFFLKDKNNTVRLKEVELINWNISINSETN